MAEIGFIGASGLMGHGMARNLLAKGHALASRCTATASASPTCSPPARRAATPAELARTSEIVFLCVTGSPQVEAVARRPRRPARRRQPRPGHRRLLDQRARFDGAPARALRARPASTSSTRRSRARRSRPRPASSTSWSAPTPATFAAARAGAARLRRERLPCRRAGRRPHRQAAQQLHRAGDLHRDGRGVRGRRSAPASIRRSWSSMVSLGAVNSGLFQMMAKTLHGDMGALKFELDNARKDIRYYTHLAEGLASRRCGRGGAPVAGAGQRARPRQEVRALAGRGPGAAHGRQASGRDRAGRGRLGRGAARRVAGRLGVVRLPWR